MYSQKIAAGNEHIAGLVLLKTRPTFCARPITRSRQTMIETTNLRLVPCELSHFEAILNDVKQLEQMLGVTVTEGWLQFPETIRFGYDYLKANPEALGWWTYLFIHTKDQALIGNGGFAGSPDA